MMLVLATSCGRNFVFYWLSEEEENRAIDT